MNHRQRVFDALAEMRGSAFSDWEVNRITGLGIETVRGILRWLHQNGIAERTPDLRDGRRFKYSLTATAKRPIDGRSKDARRLREHS